MNNTVTLRIQRSAYIERDSDVALIRLDTMNHIAGQMVMINYYGKDGEVETITAVGTKYGVGRDCYSIVSTSPEEVVNYVTEEYLPDVAELVNGAIYISNYTGAWSRVFIWNDEIRKIEPLDESDSLIFYELSTGYRWFWRRGTMYREDDFMDMADFLDILKNLGLDATMDCQFVGELQLKGTTVTEPEIFVKVMKNNVDITNTCEIKILNEQGTEQDIKSITDNTVTIYGSINSTVEYTIHVTIPDEESEELRNLEGTVRMRFVPYTIYGTTIDTDSIDSALDNLNRNNYLWSGSKDLDLQFDSLALQRTLILIPDIFSYPSSIKDRNGLDYIDDYDRVTVTFSGEQYKALLKKDAATIDNFKQILCYE